MKILVLPDIHGRTFWKEPCQHLNDYDNVIFLGDYLDPYDFDGITVENAIDNFKHILSFAKDNPKVVMLLGNHDMPYFSEEYYMFNTYHSRHSHRYHKEISALFKEYEDLFKVADVEDGILFTHAGCQKNWLNIVFQGKYMQENDEKIDLNKLCDDINDLLKTTDGLLKLYQVSFHRGGDDIAGSCIWAHYVELFEDYDTYDRKLSLYNIKQIFGHTIQAYGRYDANGNVVYSYGGPIEIGNLKMIDTACAYELDTESFTIKKVN